MRKTGAPWEIAHKPHEHRPTIDTARDSLVMTTSPSMEQKAFAQRNKELHSASPASDKGSKELHTSKTSTRNSSNERGVRVCARAQGGG
jgi:hypothetical protein